MINNSNLKSQKVIKKKTFILKLVGKTWYLEYGLLLSSFIVLMECVRLVSDQQFCGGRITKAQGEIKTPNWPDKKYPPGTSCSWLITVEPDMVCSTLTPSMQTYYFPIFTHPTRKTSDHLKSYFCFCLGAR